MIRWEKNNQLVYKYEQANNTIIVITTKKNEKKKLVQKTNLK